MSEKPNGSDKPGGVPADFAGLLSNGRSWNWNAA